MNHFQEIMNQIKQQIKILYGLSKNMHAKVLKNKKQNLTLILLTVC